MKHFSFLSKATAPVGNLIGDTYPPFAVYSVRRVVTGATLCMRIRRQSDNAELDIGFVSDYIDTETIISFCAGTRGYVKTWYDQTTGLRHLTNVTTSEQPSIYSSGAVETKNGKVGLRFLTTNLLDYAGGFSFLSPGNAFSLFSVGSGDVTENNYAFICNSFTSGNRLVQFMDLRTTPFRNLFIQTTVSSYAADLSKKRTGTGNRYLSFFSNTSNQISGFDNGATGGTSTYSGTYSNDVFRIGAQHLKQTPLNGYIQEVWVFNTNQSANRVAIETSIATFYSI